MLKDMKEMLSSNRKPDITHVRIPLMNYIARACEWGVVRYIRANYLRPVAEGGYTGTPTPADFQRLRAYLRAAVSHVGETLDAMERHLAVDPDLQDVDGMKRAAFAADLDVTTKGPSLLPHLAPACASLQMAICQAVECGLLPRDPGTPWTGNAELAQLAPAGAVDAILEAKRRADAELEELRRQEYDPYERAVAANKGRPLSVENTYDDDPRKNAFGETSSTGIHTASEGMQW